MKFSSSNVVRPGRPRTVVPLAGFGMALLMAVCARTSSATSYSWNNIGTDFNTSANWTPTTGYPGVGGSTTDIAVFATAATVNPNLSASDTIATLNFSNSAASGYTLSATNGASLTLLSTGSSSSSAINASNNGGSTNTISAPIVLGAAAGTVQVFTQAGGGTLAITGALSNTNALTDLLLTGNGTFSFSNANTGLTAPVNMGSSSTAPTIIVGSNTALGTGQLNFVSTAAVTGGGTGGVTFESADGSARTIANTIGSLSGTVNYFGAAGTGVGSGNLTFTGGGTGSGGYINLGSTQHTFVVNNAVTTFTGALGGSGGSLVKDGTGTLILSGLPGGNAYGRGSATAYGYGTTITRGTFQIGDGGANGQAISSVAPVNNNSTFIVNSSDAVTLNGSLVGTGTLTHQGAGTLTVGTVTSAATLNGTNSVQVTAQTGFAVGSTVSGTGIPAGTTVTAIGVPSGGVTTLTLSNATASGVTNSTVGYANSYAGTTSVTGGTMIVNATHLGAGAYSVTGGTLGGVGTINNGANTVAIGNGTTGGNVTGATNGTVGMLTLITATLTFNGASDASRASFLVDINGATADNLSVAGGLALTGSFDHLTFNILSAPTATSYSLINYTGATVASGFVVDNLPAGYALQYNANEIDLVAVPEPATWVGCIILFTVLGWRHRRRASVVAV